MPFGGKVDERERQEVVRIRSATEECEDESTESPQYYEYGESASRREGHLILIFFYRYDILKLNQRLKDPFSHIKSNVKKIYIYIVPFTEFFLIFYLDKSLSIFLEILYCTKKTFRNRSEKCCFPKRSMSKGITCKDVECEFFDFVAYLRILR